MQRVLLLKNLPEVAANLPEVAADGSKIGDIIRRKGGGNDSTKHWPEKNTQSNRSGERKKQNPSPPPPFNACFVPRPVFGGSAISLSSFSCGSKIFTIDVSTFRRSQQTRHENTSAPFVVGVAGLVPPLGLVEACGTPVG